MSRRLYSEHPPRAEYALTDQGLELRPVVRALGIWGARHLGSSWTFVHEACGANVEIAYYCPTCDETVATDQIKRRPAPVQRRPARGRNARRELALAPSSGRRAGNAQEQIMMNVTRASGLAIGMGATVMLLAGFAGVRRRRRRRAPTNAVLTTLTVKSDVDRAQLMKVMPAEVRETVKLYLDGKIQQWYARSDGKGVVFILNCSSVAEAKALTDTLPLSKNKLADFEYMPLGPLTPLRFLLAEPATPPRD